MTVIAPTLQAFFSDRLAKQLNASPRTIESYRDTLSLLLRFVQDTTGKPPSALDWDELARIRDRCVRAPSAKVFSRRVGGDVHSAHR